ncbi:MAG: ParB/RepB/Spo0J family partition protein [Methylococcaceae bacterium]
MVDVSLINDSEALSDFINFSDGQLPTSQNSEHFSKEVLSLPTDKVKAKEQVRKTFSNIDELADTITEHGQQQPIVVDPENEDGFFIIQAGERRYQACIKLGINVLAIVNDREDSSSDLEVLQVIENGQRDDLTPFEIGEALQKMIDKYGYTQEQIAEKIGKNVSYIGQHIRVNSIRDDLKKTIQNAKLFDRGMLETLARIDEIKPKIAVNLVENNATRKECKDALAKLKKGKQVAVKPKPEDKNLIMIRGDGFKASLSHQDKLCLITKKLDHETAEITYTESKLTANIPFSELTVTGCED